MRKNIKKVQAEKILSDPRWAAVLAHDTKADGQFYYSVRTTGIYCRPSCRARLPRPQNVAFHETCKEAEAAGFRPCLRCEPRKVSHASMHVEKIAGTCRLIEQALEQTGTIPALNVLAKKAGFSPWHFHRVFKNVTGLTPKAYASAHRSSRMREGLAGGDPITNALYKAGYNSSGRFYAQSNAILGMTPSRFRAEGANADICFAVGECSLGSVLVAQSTRGICAILLGDDPELLVQDLQNRFRRANLISGDASFEKIVALVVGLIDKPGTGLDLPLDIRGTVFQQRVWQALKEIPLGTTASYTDIARQIGFPNSVRAVAGACAANALAIAIPCHRVVKSDGALSGYRWGIERKRKLLEVERARKACETACH